MVGWFGQGQYVGTHMDWVDSTIPTINGTGNEDYFCGLQKRLLR